MKPIIIGLHNPYSDNPKYALVPYREGSSGHRLWKTTQMPQAVYINGFDRRNLSPIADPSSKDLKRFAKTMDIPTGSTVILLGHDVLRAFVGSGRPLKPILIHPQVHDGVTWRWLPHPSGRSTKYNDPVFRMLVGMTLSNVLIPALGPIQRC